MGCQALSLGTGAWGWGFTGGGRVSGLWLSPKLSLADCFIGAFGPAWTYPMPTIHTYCFSPGKDDAACFEDVIAVGVGTGPPPMSQSLCLCMCCEGLHRRWLEPCHSTRTHALAPAWPTRRHQPSPIPICCCFSVIVCAPSASDEGAGPLGAARWHHGAHRAGCGSQEDDDVRQLRPP